jgi:hypothetical protein
MSKNQKRSAVRRAIEQLIMEDYEVFVRGSVATFADGNVGIDSESRLLFCDNPRHMEFLPPMTAKVEIVERIKAFMKQVELMKERPAENLEGNRGD